MRGFAFAVLAVATCLTGGPSQAQNLTSGASTIALKSGESAELFNVSYSINCKSILKTTPEIEVIEGPPEVSLTVKPAMVQNRWAKCANKLPGGTVIITAKEIEEQSLSSLTVRVNYKTKDGDRKFSHVFNLSLFP